MSMSTTQRPLETGWLVDTPVDDSALRRFLHNQADFGDLLAVARGGRTARTADVAMSEVGPVSPLMNMDVLLRPLTGPDDGALDAIAGFHDPRVPGVVLSAWPTPDLTGRGWELVGHPMFVVRSPHALDPSPLPDGVEVAAVTDVEQLTRYEQVLLEGYPMEPASDGKPMLASGLVGSAAQLWVASVDGLPVAVAACHVAHGIVNLCGAATLPAARRRGAWRSLVEARLAAGPDLPAAAFTSDDSRPGFVAMGFVPVARFTLWRRPAGGGDGRAGGVRRA